MTYEPSLPIFQAIGYWQTLIAGVLAVIAGAGAVYATITSANREIAAAQEQTKAARDQITTTLDLERRRNARESYGFLEVLVATMERTLEDVDAARAMLPTPGTGHSREAYYARMRVQKAAYNELRSACLRLGGRLAAPFLRLDRDIDRFREWEDTFSPASGSPIRVASKTNFENELDSIASQAKYVKELAESELQACLALLVPSDLSGKR